ncbi:hypothetical protein AQUCO_01600069v1 [Aquilegia coerulea]|uniref:protein-serine/threonine phosphatase n=1 Tax=Aquilegia coerulea TaxID=218851 RepID=A0A2G5DQ07_AQUCA|nr:hypothetical protein AQUCO_01600069v1 [Aquilegia coerulea]
MMKSVVIYQGNSLLGEVEIYYNPKMIKNNNIDIIEINHFSQQSERCTPLAVLHTIAQSGLCFKLESKSSSSQSSPELFSLHSSCLRENKTAVMTLGEEELHLVAMPSRRNLEQFSCFWGFIVAPGLYNSCLNMLNLRCLGIVFDLDETLVVANTMRSFEDRIDSIQRKLNTEMDPQRISGMLAEIKRYQDDKIILKQYVESDQVVENGKVIKVQSELVPALSEDHQPIVRPLIRLREKNIILTRINPLIRDTSVLVRLRPAWEELRSYLTARGRKRFEVYVCTMAERDYALEMWRLLDPESNLINSKQLLDRIVCVKAGSRKSLLNVFHDGICHPKMALVIDDRLKVWDEKDQPRVHVVPAFAPYYAPQAEANNVIPVLCVARNVACNVRGGFFKEFDDGLLQKIPEVSYEDDLENIPSAPDVSNFLISEDDSAAPSKDPLGFDGMADVEVERRIKDATSSSETTTLDPRHIASLQPAVASLLSSILQPNAGVMSAQSMPFPLATSSIKPASNVGPIEPSLQCSPAREEGEVPESELDPDTRRRLLILQHGQDTRDQIPSEPPVPVRPPIPVSIPPVHPHGNWPPFEEKINSSRQPNQAVPKPVPKELPVESDMKHFDKHQTRYPTFFRGMDSFSSSNRFFNENLRFPKEAHQGDDRFKLNHSLSKKRSSPAEETPLDPTVSSIEEHPARVLQTIARKCRTMVEFRPSLVSTTELQFSIEVWFAGEKVGEGVGRTRREAQYQAAEHALRNLANKYLSNASSDPISAREDLSKLLYAKGNGFLGESNSSSYETSSKDDFMPTSGKSEPSRFLEGFNRTTSSLSALKELCTVEGLPLVFQDHSPLPTDSMLGEEFHAQVEIGGQVLGSGLGSTWDEAKMRVLCLPPTSFLYCFYSCLIYIIYILGIS